MDTHVKCSFFVQNSKSMIISVPYTNFHIALSQVKYIIDKDISKKEGTFRLCNNVWTICYVWNNLLPVAKERILLKMCQISLLDVKNEKNVISWALKISWLQLPSLLFVWIKIHVCTISLPKWKMNINCNYIR